MPRINIFNGGLRTAQAPHLIKKNESVALVNIDHISGIIVPIKDKILSVSGASKYGHFFTTDSTWYWSITPKKFVEFQERLYIGNYTGISTKIIGGVEFNMGIQQPTAIPIIAVSNETPEQNEITRLDLVFSADVAKDIPAGVSLKYKVVNIDSSGKKYSSNTIFTIRITSDLDLDHADYNKNKVTVTCTDTNIDDTIAIFRFFDNYSSFL